MSETPTGSERLDRIERALELMLDDHVLFREAHKELLTAQALVNGLLERLERGLENLTASVEQMRENFDARLKRLEA